MCSRLDGRRIKHAQASQARGQAGERPLLLRQRCSNDNIEGILNNPPRLLRKRGTTIKREGSEKVGHSASGQAAAEQVKCTERIGRRLKASDSLEITEAPQSSADIAWEKQQQKGTTEKGAARLATSAPQRKGWWVHRKNEYTQ